MYVEAILALMRMTESGEEVVANLAKMILMLVEQLREFELALDWRKLPLKRNSTFDRRRWRRITAGDYS